jgi:hypothetical protein
MHQWTAQTPILALERTPQLSSISQPKLDASFDTFQKVACVIILGVIAIYAIVAVLERYKDTCTWAINRAVQATPWARVLGALRKRGQGQEYGFPEQPGPAGKPFGLPARGLRV